MVKLAFIHASVSEDNITVLFLSFELEDITLVDIIFSNSVNGDCDIQRIRPMMVACFQSLRHRSMGGYDSIL